MDMTSQRKLVDLCDTCKWKLDRYNIINSANITLRNKISKKLENESNAVKGKKCFSCGVEIPNEKKLEEEKMVYKAETAEISSEKVCKSKLTLTSDSHVSYGIIFVVAIFIFVIGIICLNLKATGNILDTELPKLIQKYPNQNPELWYNVLKITNATKPLVHVLILLHKGNSKVAECFAKDLTTLINKINNKKGLVIFKENTETVEYGVELNRYLKLVSQHNHMIVLQLNKISGSTARMFHALCDEAPSSIRPSFFIFTVEDESKETVEVRRPLARAGHILRSAWGDLMENELHPLISRVVRNVAEILPENVTC